MDFDDIIDNGEDLTEEELFAATGEDISQHPDIISRRQAEQRHREREAEIQAQTSQSSAESSLLQVTVEQDDMETNIFKVSPH